MLISINKSKTTLIAETNNELSEIVTGWIVKDGEQVFDLDKDYKTIKGAKIAISRLDIMPGELVTFVIHRAKIWDRIEFVYGYKVRYVFK